MASSTTFSGDLADLHRRRAALLFAGEPAMLHERTACELSGVRYLPVDERVHLLVPLSTQRRVSEAVVLHRTGVWPRSALRDGLPVSPAGRAGLDLCRRLRSVRDVRAILSDIVQRRLATVDALADRLERLPDRGSRLPRLVLDDLLAGCRSAPECELRDVVRRSMVLPSPQWNADVYSVEGLPLGRADAWWPDAWMSGEVNSREHHFWGEDWESTMRRQARFAAAGVLVVPVSPRRLRTEPSRVLAELESAYLSRVPRPAV